MVGPLAGLLRKQAVALHAEACASQAASGGSTGVAGTSAQGSGAAGQEPALSPTMQRLFALARLLNVLITVRGYKTVVRGLWVGRCYGCSFLCAAIR